MKNVIHRVLPSVAIVLGATVLFSSCTVNEDAAFLVKNAETGDASKKKKAAAADSKEKQENSWAEQRKERKAAAEERKKELAEKRAKAAAEKEKAAEEKEKALAAKRKKEEMAELAEKKRAADEARTKRIADAREKAAKIKAERAAKKKAEELAANRSSEPTSRRRSGGGFGKLFAGLGSSTPSQYKSKGHDVYINQRILASLNESNSKIEIDLSDQKARVYKTGAGGQELVIETKVSTGKSGHSTSPGSFRIKEKLVEKRSTLYGRWVDSSGQTIPSAGEVGSRPAGASRFIGASMPYWMRINGGIGMHIGYVPEYPASHGCIRVPTAVQPLIFSKVGVGTSVTVVQ